MQARVVGHDPVKILCEREGGGEGDRVEAAHPFRVEQSRSLAHLPADVDQRDVFEQRLRDPCSATKARRRLPGGTRRQGVDAG